MKLIKLGLIALSICSTSAAMAAEYKIENVPVEGLLYYDAAAKLYFQENGNQPLKAILYPNQRKAFDNYVRACQHFKNSQAQQASASDFIAASCSESDPAMNVGPYATARGWQYQSMATVIVGIPDDKAVTTNNFDVTGVETMDRSLAIQTYFKDCFDKVEKIRAMNADKYVYAHCGSREESGIGKNFLYSSRGVVYVLDELNSGGGGNWWEDVNDPKPVDPVAPVEPVTPVAPVEPIYTCDQNQLSRQIIDCNTNNQVMSSNTSRIEGEIGDLSSVLIRREAEANSRYSSCQSSRNSLQSALNKERVEAQQIANGMAQIKASSHEMRTDLVTLKRAKEVRAWTCTVRDGKYAQNGVSVKTDQSKVKALSQAFDACLAAGACSEHGYNWSCSAAQGGGGRGPGPGSGDRDDDRRGPPGGGGDRDDRRGRR